MLGSAAVVLPLAAQAQQANKVFRIGYVGLHAADRLPERVEAFVLACAISAIKTNEISSLSTVGRTNIMNGFRRSSRKWFVLRSM